MENARIIQDIMFDQVTFIIPPKTINNSLYLCDKIFHIEELINLYKPSIYIGLSIIIGQNTEYYSVDIISMNVEKLSHQNTRLKSHNKGGSSSARFGRIHDEKVQHYLTSISEDMTRLFSNTNTNENNKNEFKYVVISGCGDRKDQLYKYLDKRITNKLIGTVTVESFEIDFILPEISKLYFAEESKQEEILLSRFVKSLNTDDGKAIYGPKDIKHNLLSGKLKTLYVNTNVKTREELKQLQNICNNFGTNIVEIGKSEQGQTLSIQFGNLFGMLYFVC